MLWIGSFTRRTALLMLLAAAASARAALPGSGAPERGPARPTPARRPQPEGRAYGPRGEYVGRTDRDGRTYDSRGRYVGRAAADGRVYSPEGRYVGSTGTPRR
ncbi:hypothetical protein MUN46_007720 [Mesosutterella sp. AGMB02718]|uniref:Uncharacterized protein n=1 Tax=Mesosutterella faecium TaxID=2925194 RepID=A0ABT7IN63_9BURK|nr:hypothetical protein [Mesosutterella sp. AGMB02718]MDL2059815.1 hypothetical protein [Mesosutterella sp. AGMB02718]